MNYVRGRKSFMILTPNPGRGNGPSAARRYYFSHTNERNTKRNKAGKSNWKWKYPLTNHISRNTDVSKTSNDLENVIGGKSFVKKVQERAKTPKHVITLHTSHSLSFILPVPPSSLSGTALRACSFTHTRDRHRERRSTS